MRSFLIFISSVAFIFLVISFVGLLLPSKVTVTKSVLINAKSENIRRQISDFNNWKNWNPLLQKEAVNAIYNQLRGNQPSLSLNDNSGKQIDFKLIHSSNDTITVAVESHSPIKLVYQFLLIPHLSGKNQLTLNVNAHFKWYPWEKIKGVFMDKMSGQQYEIMLNNLKTYLEK